MAYWHNYRKFAAEACAVAHAESSEETMNETQNCMQDISTVNSPDVHDSENELLSSNDSSSDDKNTLDPCESQKECSLNPVKTFGDELASWATKYQVQHAAVNDLLELSQKQGNALPKDAQTLLGTPRGDCHIKMWGAIYLLWACTWNKASSFKTTISQI